MSCSCVSGGPARGFAVASGKEFDIETVRGRAWLAFRGLDPVSAVLRKLAFQALSMCHTNCLAMIHSCRCPEIDVQKIHHLLEEGRATPYAMKYWPRWNPFVHFLLP